MAANFNYYIRECIKRGWRLSFRPSHSLSSVLVTVASKNDGHDYESCRIASTYQDCGPVDTESVSAALKEAFDELASNLSYESPSS